MFQFLVLFEGKIYEVDLGNVVDIHDMKQVEITTHLTDKGITYTIAKEENDND